MSTGSATCLPPRYTRDIPEYEYRLRDVPPAELIELVKQLGEQWNLAMMLILSVQSHES